MARDTEPYLHPEQLRLLRSTLPNAENQLLINSHALQNASYLPKADSDGVAFTQHCYF